MPTMNEQLIASRRERDDAASRLAALRQEMADTTHDAELSQLERSGPGLAKRARELQTEVADAEAQVEKASARLTKIESKVAAEAREANEAADRQREASVPGLAAACRAQAEAIDQVGAELGRMMTEHVLTGRQLAAALEDPQAIRVFSLDAIASRLQYGLRGRFDFIDPDRPDGPEPTRGKYALLPYAVNDMSPSARLSVADLTSTALDAVVRIFGSVDDARAAAKRLGGQGASLFVLPLLRGGLFSLVASNLRLGKGNRTAANEKGADA